MDGQGTKWHRNIAENFNRLSRAHEVTDRQTTDGRTTTYSEHELEFTFANKIAQRKRSESSITQPWITRIRSNFVQSLSAWHPKCCKRSRSRGRRSRSQRDVTCSKIRKIINNSAGDYAISLEFPTDVDHVTLDVPRTFKVSGSKVKVTCDRTHQHK